MASKQLHQVVNTMLIGDATSDHVFLIRRWLRDLGFDSEIYALNCDSGLRHEVQRFDITQLEEKQVVIFHHTMGSSVLAELADHNVPLILIYHNITPPAFFSDAKAEFIEELNWGRRQLEEIRPITRLALSDSPYSKKELLSLGYENAGVLPIVLDETQYDIPVDETLFQSCRSGGPLLLFVGRISQNKRQEDLIKLLYFYRRIEPQARLVLVGSTRAEQYVSWLKSFAEALHIGDAVTFTGLVTQQEMVTYYKVADVFMSMSEHEGFGKPLIESMYFQLPVLAYASTAVPSTLGGAGILFSSKNFEALAELVDMTVRDKELRQRIVDGQSERVQAFLEPTVQQQWRDYLSGLDLF